MGAYMIALILVATIPMKTTQCSKILFIPPDHHANANYLGVAGRALIEAGHEVHFLTLPRHKNLVDSHGLKALYFHPIQYRPHTENGGFLRALVEPLKKSQMTAMINEVTETVADLCHQMLKDEQLNAKIATAGYNIAVVESMDFARCLMVIPYRHGIPHISIGFNADPWSARVSASPSAEGNFGLHFFADPYNPSAWERWSALWTEIRSYSAMPPRLMNEDFITKYAPNKPAITMRELHQAAEIIFINMETCCLDFARVSAPHYKHLGGIGREVAKPLTGEFKEFADNAKNGLIVVSFGSGIKGVPMSRMEVMVTAFKKISQRVAMRHDGPRPTDIPSNVLLAKWLPQNDLLGHSNTRLFITHGGGNGQMEALYHGVPFISIPIMGDQRYNAERGVARGFGTVLDYYNFTADDLFSSIRQVIDDPSYREKITNCSAKYKALPSPQKTFIFWVEYVIKHGGDHLKPTYLKMALWRWFDLDILVICFIFIHSIIHIARLAFKCVRLVFRKCKE